MIDTHCHLDSFVAAGIADEVVARARAAGVEKLLLAGTRAEDWPLYRQLAGRFAGTCFYAVGLHPEYCERDDWREQISQLPDFVAGATAIGEIGLDEHYMPKSAEQAAVLRSRQEQMFREQLAIAKTARLPVIIHAREAFDRAVAMIDESGVDWRKVVFHCFSETPEQVKILNARGGRASFTGTITYKNAQNVRDSALAQGLERLMLETDAPYLAPGKMRGKTCEPAFVVQTAAFVAELFGVPVEEIDARTTANACEFFGF
ncbi:MAG: TatD family hydrolase [Opitutales bacterium]|nr:TatD family hydrolase [Opitutales bacterium]